MEDLCLTTRRSGQEILIAWWSQLKPPRTLLNVQNWCKTISEAANLPTYQPLQISTLCQASKHLAPPKCYPISQLSPGRTMLSLVACCKALTASLKRSDKISGLTSDAMQSQGVTSASDLCKKNQQFPNNSIGFGRKLQSSNENMKRMV